LHGWHHPAPPPAGDPHRLPGGLLWLASHAKLVEKMLRSIVAAILPHPARFRAALRLARLGRPLRGLFARLASLKPLGSMLELAPSSIPAHHNAAPLPAVKPSKGRIILMQGCAEPVLRPEIRDATLRLLARAGFTVDFAPGEKCCGALVQHMGRETDALAAARTNVAAWSREIERGLETIVITASGCGTTIKDYGFMLRGDPAWADKAAHVSALARDVSELLDAAGLPVGARGAGITVAYQSACSLQHGQAITAAPQQLLAAAGFTVKQPAEAHLCCGSAGTYNLFQPDIAGQLGGRKAARLDALDSDVIASGNIGCATQLAPRVGVPVVHTVELLDWATGGPLPPALAGNSRFEKVA
jgi:glycolate oxidase iron-sulfur subunit